MIISICIKLSEALEWILYVIGYDAEINPFFFLLFFSAAVVSRSSLLDLVVVIIRFVAIIFETIFKVADIIYRITVQIVFPVFLMLYGLTIGTICSNFVGSDEDHKASKVERNTARPSRFAEMLLFLFLTKEQREHLPADLEEEFRTLILPKFGQRFARFWYWSQVIRSIGPVAGAAVRRWLLHIGGGIGLVKVLDWLRKFGS